jgi:two-component system cell cycle sensor histidine kinase/response regulator CckA
MSQAGFTFLLEISELLSDSTLSSPHEVLPAVLAKVAQYARADGAWLIQVRKHRALMTHQWRKDQTRVDLDRDVSFLMRDLQWFTEKLTADRIICIEKESDIPREAIAAHRVFLRQRLKGLLVLPIILDGVPIAAIGISWTNTQPRFSDDLVQSSTIFSQLVAPIIQRQILETSNEELDLRFQTVLDNLTEGVTIGDLDDCIIYVNHRYAQMLGYTPEELLGKKAFEFVIPQEEQHKILEGTSRRLIGSSDSYEITQLTKDKRRLTTIINACPYRNVHGEVIGNIACHIDITEQRKVSQEAATLQQHLFQVQKMEAVGQLAAGLAHDLNNHLTAIVGHLHVMQQDSTASEVTRSSAHAALSGCHIASDMIRQLLSFSTQTELSMNRVSLKTIVESCLDLSRSLLDKNTTYKVSGQLGDHFILADRNQLSQVITNLIINAIHAMPKGGTIGFHYSLSDVEQVKYSNPQAEPGRYVVLTISDSGCGIPEENLSKLFEPFFTTKKEGEGSGLGLSMAYAIMQKHGGWIEVDSQVGSGSAFSLYLPMVGEPSVQHLQSQVVVTRDVESSLGTVLIIDDEPVLAELACSFLDRAGFKTFSFSDPFAAFTWYEQHKDQVSLILLDMKMPQCHGAESFEKLKAINPEAQIVLISGYVDDVEVSRLLARGALSFIQKPIKYSELVEWITKTVKIAQAGTSVEPLFH